MRAKMLRGVLVALSLSLTAAATIGYGQARSSGKITAGGSKSPSVTSPSTISDPGFIRRGNDMGATAGVDSKAAPGGIIPRGDPFGIGAASDPFTISQIGGPPPGLLGPPVAVSDRRPGPTATAAKQKAPSAATEPAKQKPYAVPPGPIPNLTKPKHSPAPSTEPAKAKTFNTPPGPIPILNKPKSTPEPSTAQTQVKKIPAPQTDPITYERP
jgi:hypothetical protein